MHTDKGNELKKFSGTEHLVPIQYWFQYVVHVQILRHIAPQNVNIMSIDQALQQNASHSLTMRILITDYGCIVWLWRHKPGYGWPKTVASIWGC